VILDLRFTITLVKRSPEAVLGRRLSLHLLEEHFLRHDVETNVMSDNTLLAHLTQRVMRCITITWRPSSSVIFYILIFFYETITPIGTNLVGMFNRWSPYIVYV
jgi:hypothetical protein